MHEIKNITITPEILKFNADIDEFKGHWKALETLARTHHHQPRLQRQAGIRGSGVGRPYRSRKFCDEMRQFQVHDAILTIRLDGLLAEEFIRRRR